VQAVVIPLWQRTSSKVDVSICSIGLCYAYLVCDSLGAGAQESKSQRGTKHMQKTVSESSNDVSNDGKAKKVAPAV
jgi:hypothetical protein